VHLPFSHFLRARDVASLFHAKTPCRNYDTSKQSRDAHFSHVVLGRLTYCTSDDNAHTVFFPQETGSYNYIQLLLIKHLSTSSQSNNGRFEDGKKGKGLDYFLCLKAEAIT